MTEAKPRRKRLDLKTTGDLLDLMRSKGVQSFTYDNLTVTFEPQIPTHSGPMTIDDKSDRLSALKQTLKEAKEEELNDLLWSTGQ